jgi:endonuclease/exonuclease/phosphatase family metal-dependent hydrolase
MRTAEPHPLEPDRHGELHPVLDHWRTNVGEPVAFDGSDAAPDQLSGIDVLCWNVAIGLGHLDFVIEWLQSGAGVAAVAVAAAQSSARSEAGSLISADALVAGSRVAGAGQVRSTATGPIGAHASPEARPADRPLVILLQEAFRSGASVPDAAASGHHGGRLAGAARVDIVELAERHGLSLRYSPSMRNGRHASDRGNAVLSTARLADAQALLLPYVRQRRVVVSATLEGHPRLRFVSAHLDTHGRSSAVAAGGPFGGGRAAQARALGRMLAGTDGSVVLGADLNSVMGMSDVAIRELVAAGMHPAHRVGSWRHTYHTRFRLLLDHVMFRSPDQHIARVDVIRLDEAARDRSRTVFGSDHHPLLATIELQEPRPQ